MADPDLWSFYRTFLAVAEEGSLSAAGRRLGLSQPTVGRHIEALEQHLGGTALFTRSPRGLQLTESAEAMRPHIETMGFAAASAERASGASAAELGGVVRVSASEIVGAEVLPAMFGALQARHPRLAIELSLSNRTEDLLRRQADIAVRMVEPAQEALFVARIGTVELGLFGHRRYLAENPAPASLADLAQHRIVGFDRETPFLRGAAPQLALHRTMFSLRTDSDLGALAALRAGFGLGVTQLPIARRDPDLIPVLADEVRFSLGIWIAMHEDLKRQSRMRAVFDHLVAGMRAYIAG